MSRIVERIERSLQLPGLFDALASRLSASELGSLLLGVFGDRAAACSATELLQRAERTRMALPSAVDARARHAVEGVAFRVAREFAAIDLAPVTPFASCRALSGLDQDLVLTALRNAEVIADPTVAIALECARRRRDPAGRRAPEPLRFCTSQRVLRMQPLPDIPGYSPHFCLFALVSAGRDRGNHSFETSELREHVRFYLAFFRALAELGYRFGDVVVEVSDTEVVSGLLHAAGIERAELRGSIRAQDPRGSAAALQARGVSLPKGVLDPARELQAAAAGDEAGRLRLARVKSAVFESLAPEFPEVAFSFDLSRLEGIGYYSGLMLRISVADREGRRFAIADGGFTHWTRTLLRDEKERFFGTGIGTELICKRFRAQS